MYSVRQWTFINSRNLISAVKLQYRNPVKNPENYSIAWILIAFTDRRHQAREADAVEQQGQELPLCVVALPGQRLQRPAAVPRRLRPLRQLLEGSAFRPAVRPGDGVQRAGAAVRLSRKGRNQISRPLRLCLNFPPSRPTATAAEGLLCPPLSPDRSRNTRRRMTTMTHTETTMGPTLTS